MGCRCFFSSLQPELSDPGAPRRVTTRFSNGFVMSLPSVTRLLGNSAAATARCWSPRRFHPTQPHIVTGRKDKGSWLSVLWSRVTFRAAIQKGVWLKSRGHTSFLLWAPRFI